MRTASAQLIALLHGSNTYMMADLYTVTLRGGEVLRWTDADTDLVLGSDFFSCNGPILTRGNTRLKVGLEVDTLDLTLGFGEGALLRNLLRPEHARFAGALPGNLSSVFRGEIALDPAESYFGGGSLKLSATDADAYFFLGNNTGDYNLPLKAGKTYLCSAYVKSNEADRRGQFYIKDIDGYHGSSWQTSLTAGEWTRVAKPITVGANADSGVLRIDNDGFAGCDMWLDGIMVEEVADGVTEPSPFVMPFGDAAPSPAAARNGAFDGARIRLERVFMPTWGDTSYGALLLYEGEVAGADPSRQEVRLTVKSELDRLNVPMPATLLKPACANMVYDTNCGLDRAAWTVSGTVGAGASKTLIPSGLGQADNYFDLGVLAITSGPAAGSRRAVRAYSGGSFTLSMPLDSQPEEGDSFTVYPGCYRTKAACDAKGNDRFRGFPYVPAPEQAR